MSKKKDEKKKASQMQGIFCANSRGFGFVAAEGEEKDIFIPPDKTAGAMDQDTVEILVEAPATEGKRKEGSVLKILEHAKKTLVGRYEKGKGFGFVVPDDQKITQDLFIDKGDALHARNGEKVVAEITKYADDKSGPEGRIIELLGMEGDPGVDVFSIVRDYDVPVEFPPKVIHLAKRIPQEISENDRKGRRDFRDLQTVTIDGEDAKDLDDAITLTKDAEGYHLGVHIADVSHYVLENSALDREARKRGTSIYPVDRVIPMLPVELSNGICSLNQGQDRLTLSCLMRFDLQGNIVDHEITEGVLRVDRRMTYTDVNKIITEHDAETMETYRDFCGMFFLMKELSDLIRVKRRQRGSIDFDFPETKVILDEKGHPLELKPYDRNAAAKLIEDFMLSANETIAEDYFWRQIPFLYRVHAEPEQEKIRALSLFIQNFGLHIRGISNDVHPKELQKLLTKIDGTPEEPLIARLTLRSMRQAKYSTVNIGHFGLAARYYCHFTSPIRRYPDLQIHRIIKDGLHGKLNDERLAHYEEILPKVAEECSKNERRADEIERETVKLKKAEYMLGHLGETFTGIISGVTGYGFYVELPDTIEGLVHINTLKDDYYEFVRDSYCLTGEQSGRTFELGQTVRVTAVNADLRMRTVDFKLAEEGPEEPEDMQ